MVFRKLKEGSCQPLFNGVQFSDVRLPFSYVALAQHWAWYRTATVLLNQPAASDLAVNSIERALKPGSQRILARYLMAASLQIGRLRRLALLLGVPPSMLLPLSESDKVAAKCMSAAKCLPDAADVQPITLYEYTSRDEIEKAATTEVAKAITHHEAKIKNCTLLSHLMHGLHGYLRADFKTLCGQPNWARECAIRGVNPRANPSGPIFALPQLVLISSAYVSPLETAAAFVLLGAKDPVDGQSLFLSAGPLLKGHSGLCFLPERITTQTLVQPLITPNHPP